MQPLISAEDIHERVQALAQEIARDHPLVGKVFKERKLEAHDIQNTLCELSKYVRVKNGGHAKNQYPPKEK